MSFLEWRTVIDGYTFDVKVEHDHVARPEDYECYTTKQVEAWERDDWQFVGIVVRPNGTGAEASLWGLEWGTWTDTDEDDNVTGQRYIGMDDDFIKSTVEELAHEALTYWLPGAEERIVAARSWIERCEARWAKAREEADIARMRGNV